MTIYTQLIVALFFLLMTGYLLYTYLNKKAVNERFIYFTFVYFIFVFTIFFLERESQFSTIKTYLFIYLFIMMLSSFPLSIFFKFILIKLLPETMSNIDLNFIAIMVFYLSSILQWFVIIPFIIKKIKGKG